MTGPGPLSADGAPAGGVRVRVLSTELPPTDPLQLYEALTHAREHDDVYLFESLDGPAQDRHYAAVGYGRLAELRVFAGRVELTAGGELGAALAASLSSAAGEAAGEHGGVRRWSTDDSATVWRMLRAVQSAFVVDTDVPTDTFAFGFLTTLSYEAAWLMEELPEQRADVELPRCTLTLFRDTVWYGLRDGGVRHLSAHGDLFPAENGPPLWEVLDTMKERGTRDGAPVVPAAPAPRSVRDTVDRETFIARAERCLGHIGVGDSYQIQIGHRIDVKTELTPLQVYQRLRHRNPSPYMYLVPWAGRTVIGASPELFVRIQDGHISMRPIAGTAPRAADPAEDARLVAGLRESAKEQAEHVMLVDLCRNDIGRVCVPGTLSVDTMMEAEPFAYVHHLVSTVSGRVRDGTDVWASICATFPAGTMTGAPKLRAMEIISEIEDQPRGIYAGALGLVDVRGFSVLALCIRTTVHDGQRYSTQASAGVVADSVPADEWRETLAKMSATYWALTGEELLT
ncbi:anthranilate synthase component I family protein [Streptomyces sp. NBC_01754]|uniref:anthranilate synthase component I family protein n=1 Tax=Streptomyces sp. NBC_01754 TaxID=2975930 RepID=UPI002DDC18BE|nr:anthranilate synthase component I family protein [Streptomyces sp. NBC_01754]WSC93591.1 anthranilate synthase component I family protein [Streptomyces sp. NBC_01754]